jgi:uncharacterized membrane protein YccC
LVRSVETERRGGAAISGVRSLALFRKRVAAVRAAIVPDWLAELVRPKPIRPPWPDMLRGALAICVPLAVAFGVGNPAIGLLPAIGGLLGTMTDRGGAYLARVKRVSSVGVFGGAVGLTIGALIHHRGWIAVIALVVVAGVSALMSAVGELGSQTGLQLLVYTTLGLSPLGGLRPVWHTALGFLVGVVWAVVLILPGWLLSPHGQQQRTVAAVYQAVADQLGAIGTDGLIARRQAVTSAIGTAYDQILSARAVAAGRSREVMRLVAALNTGNLLSQAATTLGVSGDRPPPQFIDAVAKLADSIRSGSKPPAIPPAWDASPGALALRDAMASAARVLSRYWSPGDKTRAELEAEAPVRSRASRRNGIFDRVVRAVGGRSSRVFVLRLMACMGVAGVFSEVLPLQRSYWVPLTVAIVLKPDYGSVFARALQRGIGTIVGAVLGAVLLALIHGEWLLIPFGLLAALLPYGRDANYGLLATFLTPLVVVLIDVLQPAGWRLAEDRLIDTVIGCAIVLLVGFAPWPMSWYAHLPRQFGQAALDVCGYMEEALGTSQGSGASSVSPVVAPAPAAASAAVAAARARRLRSVYRALGDTRAEFQRTMSEPPSISHTASALWPAAIALEQVVDAVTAVSLSVSRGASVPDSGVRQLCAALDAVSEAAIKGTPVPAGIELPDDETLQPATEAVRALLSVLASGERLTSPA